MNDILSGWLEKISGYDLINNLIPGAVFVTLIDRLTSFHILSSSILINIALCYIAGVVLGRIGSIAVEIPLKKIKIIKFCDHGEYVEAEHWERTMHSDKLPRLSAVNNMYRTLISVFLCLMIAMIIDSTAPWIAHSTLARVIICGILVLLFIISYCKQTRYVREQVAKDLQLAKEYTENQPCQK